jgi:hypothetical protein
MLSFLLTNPMARLFLLYLVAVVVVVLSTGKGGQGRARPPAGRPAGGPGGLSARAVRGVRAVCARDYAARFARAAARIRAF